MLNKAPRPRRFRVALAAGLAGVAALVTALLVPVVANAATVQLTGTVTGPSGSALSGVSVSLEQDTLGFMSQIATTTASSSGAYSFTGLTGGATYTLFFGATSSTYPQFLGKTTSGINAQSFGLPNTGASPHTTVNANLAAGGSISGSVKSITHAALKGYTVRAYANGNDGTVVRSAVTSSSGSYTLTGLTPGQYQLEALNTAAGAPYGPSFSGGASSLDSAIAIQAIGGKTVSYSFTMGKPGAISGTVTGKTTTGSIPLGGVTVTPYLLKGTSPTFTGSTTVGMTSVVTKSNGTYSLTGLIPGYYTLEFIPGASTPLSPTSDPYGRSFLDDFSGIAYDATPVHVTSGATVASTNEQLIEQSSATITVEDSVSSDPIANIDVTIDHLGASADELGDSAPTAKTDDTGAVTFHGLGDGLYEVIIGSNTGADGSITTYQREIVGLGSQLVSGETDVETIQATLKDPSGLQPTAPIAISCCGGPPWAVGFNVGVDPYLISWTDDNVDPTKDTYQWYRNGTPIAGATSNFYQLQAADAGQNVYAMVTAYDLAYGSGTAQSVSVGSIGLGTFWQNEGGGGIYGQESVGSTIKFTDFGWSIPGVHETTTWQSSSNGTTWTTMATQPPASGLALTDANAGMHYRVQVSGSLAGYNTVNYTTGAVQISDGTYTLTTLPKLTTTSSTWSVSGGVWSPNYGTTQYLWDIKTPAGVETTSPGPTLSRAGKTGDSVTVEVFRDPPDMLNDFAPRIIAQTGSAPAYSPTPTITGTDQYGSVLTVTPQTFTPTQDSFSCVWQYKYSSTVWKSIPGASACNYTPVASDIGHVLRVVTTTSLYGFAARQVILTEPSAVAALPLVNTIVPGISGIRETGYVLTTNNGTWTSAPSGFTYHWGYSKTGVAPYTTAPGTYNQASYSIPQSLLNDYLLVEVTASLTGHTTTTAINSAGLIGKGFLTQVGATKVTTTTASGGHVFLSASQSFTPAATQTQCNWTVYGPTGSQVTNLSQSHCAPFEITNYLPYYVTVQVGGDLALYNTTWTNTILARKGTNSVFSSVFLGATHVVDSPITSSGGTFNAVGTTNTYQWQYLSGSTWKSISGATSSSYTPTSTYLGKSVRLAVTGNQPNYNPLTTTSASVVVVAAAAPTAGSGGNAPILSGTNAVGNTLSIAPGTWSLTGTTFTYQWQTSLDANVWTNISGATSNHYVVPLSAYTSHDYLGVLITGTKPGHGSSSTREYTGTPSVEGTVALVTSPTVKASGSKLTVSNGTWSHATSYSYQWQTTTPIGGVVTPVGTNSASYTPGVGDAGKEVTVTVTASGPNYLSATKTVLARSGGAITPTTPITISGTVEQGSSIEADWNDFSVDSPSVSVQWYLLGKAISGATNDTFTPTAADVGHTLTVTVTVSKPGWTTEKYSVVSDIVQSSTWPQYENRPLITGTPAVDDVLTAVQTQWVETGVTTTYQWFSNGGIAIPGATSNTYTVTANDLGDDVYVLETGTHAYQAPTVVQAGPVQIGLGATLMPAGNVIKITGTPQLAKTLSVSYGAWNFPVTLTYEWQYEAPLSGTWSDIPGAQATSYTLNATDGITAGGKIQVIVHASRPGHTSVDITSPPVTVQP